MSGLIINLEISISFLKVNKYHSSINHLGLVPLNVYAISVECLKTCLLIQQYVCTVVKTHALLKEVHFIFQLHPIF